MEISFDEMRDRLTGVLSENQERNYLGMSSIGSCPRRLYFEMKNGRAMPGPSLKRLFHEGHLHEQDLLARLQQAGYVVDLYQLELVAPFDARFRGHIDGVLDGTLLEIKSVNDQRFMIVQDLGALAEHRAQAQIYMRYGGFAEALLIYKQRSYGELYFVALRHDEHESALLEAKARMILNAVDGKGALPACSCRRCP
jgi:hypothetical protein